MAEELDKAIGYVEQHASDAPKAALVLDIDETSLSNWPARLTSDYAFIKKGTCDLTIDGACGLEAWQLYAKDDAIGPTLKLYSLTKDKGVEVFFITGRCDTGHMREATKANLKSAGYGLVDDCKLIMRSQESCDTKLDTVVAFKEPARGEIEKQGYKIIANVGDQWSDLNGGLSEQNFKVPNPFYFIK